MSRLLFFCCLLFSVSGMGMNLTDEDKYNVKMCSEVMELDDRGEQISRITPQQQQVVVKKCVNLLTELVTVCIKNQDSDLCADVYDSVQSQQIKEFMAQKWKQVWGNLPQQEQSTSSCGGDSSSISHLMCIQQQMQNSCLQNPERCGQNNQRLNRMVEREKMSSERKYLRHRSEAIQPKTYYDQNLGKHIVPGSDNLPMYPNR